MILVLERIERMSPCYTLKLCACQCSPVGAWAKCLSVTNAKEVARQQWVREPSPRRTVCVKRGPAAPTLHPGVPLRSFLHPQTLIFLEKRSFLGKDS